MITQKNNLLLKEAGMLINSATNELSLSEDGITSYKVCHNSREALIKSLSYFITNSGIELKLPVTMANLLDQCKAIDSRFQNVDFSNILCRHQEGNNEYCLEYDKVSKCLKSAQLVQSIVENPVPGS